MLPGLGQQLIVVATRAQATSAGNAYDEAFAEVELISDEIDRLEEQIRDGAVRTFVEAESPAALLETGDPTLAIRPSLFPST